MHALILITGPLASGTSDNSPHGFNWTFAFPMILFIVVATVLYLLFTRPHTVPGHGELRFTPEAATETETSVPAPETARAAAVASGFTTAAGGGAAESAAEAAGAHRTASEDEESGNVSQDEDLAAEDQAAPDGPDADQPPAADQPLTAEQPATHDDPEASE